MSFQCKNELSQLSSQKISKRNPVQSILRNFYSAATQKNNLNFLLNQKKCLFLDLQRITMILRNPKITICQISTPKRNVGSPVEIFSSAPRTSSLLKNIINSSNKLSLRFLHNNQLLFWTLYGGWVLDTFLIISSMPTGETIGVISY